MNALIPYLVKMILASAIFFLYYLLLLRNRQFHHFNRFYLLASIVLSLALPLIKIDFYGAGTFQLIRNSFLSIAGTTSLIPGNTLLILLVVFIIISMVLLAILFLRIISVLKIKRTYPRKRMNGFTLIETNLPQAPFSFLNNLFWRTDLIAADVNGRKIFRHELAHIRGRHSYDKLFSQVAASIFWINPFFWLIKKELNLLHEFIADAEAINPGDVKSFAQMLLQSYNRGKHLDPVHSFFHSPVKRRLQMVSKDATTKHTILSRLLAIPLAATLLLSISFTSAASFQTNIEQQQKLAAEKNALKNSTPETTRPGKPPQ